MSFFSKSEESEKAPSYQSATNAYTQQPTSGTTSFQAPPPLTQQQPAFQTSFASLSMHMSDRLRLLQFPADLIPHFRSIITSSWPAGIQAERTYGGSYEFKFRGHPWWGSGLASTSISSRVVMREILGFLYARGWVLLASTDVSRKTADKDMLVFRKQVGFVDGGGDGRGGSEWTAISFNQRDRLRVIGGLPNVYGGDSEIVRGFAGVLGQMGLLQSEGWKSEGGGAYEFKIRGYPWVAIGEETMSTRLLMLRLLECLEGYGWSLYASIDQSATGSGDSSAGETDTWFVVKSRGWVPGMPVFHR